MADDPKTITLAFERRDGEDPVRESLSAVTQAGDDLWVGADEGTCIERLTLSDDAFARHTSFRLGDYVDLPDDPAREVDVEGLDVADGCLWVVGSHGVRRRQPDADAGGTAKRLRRLARGARRGNRYLIARIPLAPAGDGASYAPVRERDDPASSGGVVRAARLPGGRRRNKLMDELRDDDHFAPFLDVPGKDNGFNVEGFAVDGECAFLGLRGPVLRGWAAVLTLKPAVDPRDPARLRLRRVTKGGRRYAKHFLDLGGLGVRELCVDGRDLLILAGPTMQLDGRAVVYRWRGALDETLRGDCIVDRERLEKVVDLPYGAGEDEGTEHPEGMALVTIGGRRSLLVVYDSPHPRRRKGEGGVEADLFRIP